MSILSTRHSSPRVELAGRSYLGSPAAQGRGLVSGHVAGVRGYMAGEPVLKLLRSIDLFSHPMHFHDDSNFIDWSAHVPF